MQRGYLYTQNIIRVRASTKKTRVGKRKCTVYLKFCFVCGKLILANKVQRLVCTPKCNDTLNLVLNYGAAPPMDHKKLPPITDEILKKFGFIKHIKNDNKQ